MARPEFTFTVLFLIAAATTTASARNLFNYKRLAAELNLPDLTQPDPKPTLLLPSEAFETISNTVVEIDPETDEPNDFQADLPLVESKHDVPARPLTTNTVVFQPVNRHFPRKRSYRFRLPSSGCHHEEETKKSTNPSVKNQVPVMGHGTDIMFGDDMILPSEANKEPVRDAMKHQILPGRVVKVKSHRHGRHNRGGGETRRFPFTKHGQDVFVKQRKPKGEEGRIGNGFVKRIRKFLVEHF